MQNNIWYPFLSDGRSRALESGESKTRAGAGAPNRFFSKWLETLDVHCEGRCENPLRDKRKTQYHGELLLQFVFGDGSLGRLALADST